MELCGICSYNLKYIDEENNFLSNNQQFLLFEYLGFRNLKFIGLPSVDDNVMQDSRLSAKDKTKRISIRFQYFKYIFQSTQCY